MLAVYKIQKTLNSRETDPLRILFGMGAAAVAERASLPRCACMLEQLTELTRGQLGEALDKEGIRGKAGKGPSRSRGPSRWQQNMYNMQRAEAQFVVDGKSEQARLKREQIAAENQRRFPFNFAHQQSCGQQAAPPAAAAASASAPTAATATAAPLPAAPLPAADATDPFSEWIDGSAEAEALAAFFEPAHAAADVTTAAASVTEANATAGIDAQFDVDLEAIQAAAEAPRAAGAAGSSSEHSTQPTAAEGIPAAVPVAEGVAPSGAPAAHPQPCKHVFARNLIDMLRLGEHVASEKFSYSNEPIALYHCKSCPIGCGCKPTQQCPNRTCQLDCRELHTHRGLFKPILPFRCSLVAQMYKEQCRECEWLETSAGRRDLWRTHRLQGDGLKSPLHQQAVAAEAKRVAGTLGAPPERQKQLGLFTTADALSALESERSGARAAEQSNAAQIAQVCLKNLSPARLSFLLIGAWSAP